MTIGERIKLLRTEKGLTQTELAKVLNVARSTLSQYESNQRTPSDDMKLKLSNIFNVSVYYLLGKTDIKNYLEDPNVTIALHSDETSLDYSDLSDEAKKEVQDFIEYVRHKYKDK